MRRCAVIGFCALAAACLAVACLDPTQMTVEITTDVPCASMNGTRIALGAPQAGGEPAERTTSTTTCVDGKVGSIVLLPGSRQGDLVVTVVAGVGHDVSTCVAPDYRKNDADKARGCIVARRRLSFVSHKPLLLPVRLTNACVGVPCGADETCDDGRCVPAVVDPNTCAPPRGCVPGQAADAGVPDGGDADAGRDAATPDAGPAPVATLVAGGAFNCSVMVDATIRCWGDNTAGQVGDGTVTNFRSTPVTVTGMTNVVAAAAGQSHTCVLRSGGALHCWGNNAKGQLGIGNTAMSPSPTLLSAYPNVTAVAAGGSHTCAFAAASGASCWGDNTYSQLGSAAGNSATTPQPVMGLSATYFALGLNHSCAGTTPVCWGAGISGQLGNGSYTDRISPIPVSTVLQFKAMAAGAAHTCGLASANGAVWCWGANAAGQLGLGNTTPASTPQASSMQGASVVGAGAQHTCAVVAGELWCWGSNGEGQLALDPNVEQNKVQPTRVIGLAQVTNVALGNVHTCASATGAQGPGVYCWGNNTAGQLGDGTTTSRFTPARVIGL